MTRWLVAGMTLLWSVAVLAQVPEWVPGEMTGSGMGWVLDATSRATAQSWGGAEGQAMWQYKFQIVCPSPGPNQNCDDGLRFKIKELDNWVSGVTWWDVGADGVPGDLNVDEASFPPNTFQFAGARANANGAMVLGITGADAGKYVTINMRRGGAGAPNNMYFVPWMTNSAPAAIATVTPPVGKVDPGADAVVALSITHATNALPADQHVWIRWTQNGFATSSYVEATCVATACTANVPVPGVLALGAPPADITFYAFVSKVAVATDFSTSALTDPDWAALSVTNNGGSNYQISIYNLGNVWHIPANLEVPSVGNDQLVAANGRIAMLVPGAPKVTDASVVFYGGSQWQDVAPAGGKVSNVTKMVLHYSVNGGAAWSTVDGAWYAKFTDADQSYDTVPLNISAYAAGTTVLYYLEFQLAGMDSTYVFDNGASIEDTGLAATAAAAPFSFTIQAVKSDTALHDAATTIYNGDKMVQPVPHIVSARSFTVYVRENAVDRDAVAPLDPAMMRGTGSHTTLYYRFGTSGAFAARDSNITQLMDTGTPSYDYASFFLNAMPVGAQKGDKFQYYFRVAYLDPPSYSDTYVFNGGSSLLEADAQAAVFEVTLDGPTFGAGYHKPSTAEPTGHTMREPLNPNTTTDSVAKIWFAEPDAGDIDPIATARIYYSFDNGISWSGTPVSMALVNDNQSGKDYWSGDVNIAGKMNGTVLSYYLVVTYKPATGFSTSYFYGTDTTTVVAGNDTNAKLSPYTVTLAGPAIPTLSEWAMIVALCVMAFVALRQLRRRGSHSAA